MHGGTRGQRHAGDDEIDLESDEVRRWTGELVDAVVRVSPVEDKVLIFECAAAASGSRG